MPASWIPGVTRVHLGPHVAGGPYDDMSRPKAGIHTTEGSTVAGARAAFRRYPPHLCYHPGTREREQYVPLDRHAYAFAGPEADDEYVVQVELVGTARNTHTWPDEWLRNIAADIVRPLRDLVGIPPVIVRHGFLGEEEARRRGIVLASTSSPIRLPLGELRAFSGWLGHQHMPPPDHHWDPGALPMARILAHAEQEDDMITDADFVKLMYTPVVTLANGVTLSAAQLLDEARRAHDRIAAVEAILVEHIARDESNGLTEDDVRRILAQHSGPAGEVIPPDEVRLLLAGPGAQGDDAGRRDAEATG